MDFENLLVEKYRPQTLADIMLTKDVREFVEFIAKSDVKAIPHLMFYGPAGTGKSSLAKLIVQDILKCEYLYINASDQNGIDTVRGIITNFIQTKSMNGEKKVIILDEFDGFSSKGGSGSSAQEALRNILEEYANTTRFILTCNYSQKVLEPIWSRLQPFYIQPELKDFTQRCLQIMKLEKILLPSENRSLLLDLIHTTYPDLRRCLNEIQKFSITGTFQPTESIEKKVTQVVQTYWDMLVQKKDYIDIRKYIIDNEKLFRNDYHILLRNLFEHVYSFSLEDKNKKKQIMLMIIETMYYNSQVLDKEINFFALTLKIGNLL